MGRQSRSPPITVNASKLTADSRNEERKTLDTSVTKHLERFSSQETLPKIKNLDYIKIENQSIKVLYDNVTDQHGMFKPQYVLFTSSDIKSTEKKVHTRHYTMPLGS